MYHWHRRAGGGAIGDSCVVIVNPAAGNGRAGRTWPAISKSLREAGYEHRAIFTRRPGEATEICRAALRDGETTIVAAGGDGTLNEVANGFWEPGAVGGASYPDACLGVLPLGTGTDFGRSLGIGRGPRAIRPLIAGVVSPIDVGRVDFRDASGAPATRYFVNVADLGLGGETARLVQNGPRMFGALATYLIGAVRAISTYRPQRVTLRMDEGETVVEPIGLIVVANTRYFGGGMLVAPNALYDDGYFEVLYLRSTTRRRLLLDLLPRLYRGKHLGHPAVRVSRARMVTVASEGRFLLEIDGEQIGSAPATFTIIPRALQVVVSPDVPHRSADAGQARQGSRP